MSKYLFDLTQYEYINPDHNPFALMETDESLKFFVNSELGKRSIISEDREKIKHDPHATLQEEDIEPVGHAYWVIDVT